MRGEALMPCSNRKARLLLKQKKATIVAYNPFTIQLATATGEANQPTDLGGDTGAKFIGISITSENKVLAKVEVTLRDDIKGLLTTRKALRRSRRSRNTRYRRCKFKYRTSRVFDPRKGKYIKRKIAFESPREEGWLPPSIQSRVDNTIFWFNKFASLVPNPTITIEVGKFDVQQMMNPDISGTEYQEGNAYGFWSTRYYVFARDNYTCQICKKKGGILHTHHIIQRKNGGSDRADNLVTVHSACHDNFHAGRIKHVFKKPKSYKETAFMNVLRRQIFERISCKITYGNVTVVDRKLLGLEKSHANDAIAISGIKSIKQEDNDTLCIHQIRKNKRSLHEATARKGRKEPNRESRHNKKNTIMQNGFYRNDKVVVFGQVGFISGFCHGAIYVKSIDGEYITKPGKTYKQVGSGDAKFLSHNGNWQFVVQEDKQFIPHPIAEAI
jgi:hypothetical protein